jgi:hypothetical protein
LPSILSGHIYTLVTLAVVGTLLVATLNSYATSLKVTSEIEQLKNLLNHVAAKGNELLAIVSATNSSVQFFIQLPATIGYKQYWLRARNDSSRGWLEGSLGEIVQDEAEHKVFLPKGISASGYFVGSYGPAILESYMNGSTLQLNLASAGG